MIIGPKYKIARRLGAPVFEKTQTQKYALRSQNRVSKSRPKAKSEFGMGMNEKQKARYTYGITEKQFSNYVKAAISKKGNTGEHLLSSLESRLDNVALRSGFAPTRRAARQMVSHGHLMVNGGIVTIPSYKISVGDVIAIREGSKKKNLFITLEERLATLKVPAWVKLDVSKKEIKIDGIPKIAETELLFSVAQVLEFYTR